jgi:hypothetical protein
MEVPIPFLVIFSCFFFNERHLIAEDGPYRAWRPHIFSAIVSIPPILIAFATQNVSFLVNITGAYGGVGIQWLIPTVLLYYSRK